MQEQEIHDLVASVLDALKTKQASPTPSVADDGMAPATPVGYGSASGSAAAPEVSGEAADADREASLEDLGGPAFRKPCGVKEPHNPDVLQEFMRSTGARIAGGVCGTRPSTTAYLRFLADHARSKGTVFREVPEEWLRQRGMLAVQTLVEDKDTYLTRPDLGRVLSEASLQTVREHYKPIPQVLIVLSDGLSTDAVLANADEIVPPLTNGLRQAGFTVGDPLFLRYGRVKAEDRLGEAIGCDVVLMLVGERPGLGQSESMSCYAVYRPTAVTLESDRSVISNIHREGTPPVEAAAVIVDLVRQMMRHKASGIALNKALNPGFSG